MIARIFLFFALNRARVIILSKNLSRNFSTLCLRETLLTTTTLFLNKSCNHAQTLYAFELKYAKSNILLNISRDPDSGRNHTKLPPRRPVSSLYTI